MYQEVAKSRIAKSRIAKSRFAKSRIAKSQFAKSRIAKSRVAKNHLRIVVEPSKYIAPDRYTVFSYFSTLLTSDIIL